MEIFVKICGLANQEDVLRTASLRPEALGFVFWEKSPRCVKPVQVLEWTKGLPSTLLKVGVFVDEKPDVITRIMKEVGLDIAQLHGGESPQHLAGHKFRVWKALNLEKDDPAPYITNQIESLLIDSGSRELPGGTGIKQDWEQAKKFVKSIKKPVLLAGGLTPDNIENGIRKVEPWGVDVSSGVEVRPGKKDMNKVSIFIKKCRNL